jgi:uncharacterized protein
LIHAWRLGCAASLIYIVLEMRLAILPMSPFTPQVRRLVAALPALWLLLLLAGCGGGETPVDANAFIFNPIDTSFVATELKIPGGKYHAKIIYTEGTEERVEWKNVMAPAKGKHDFMAYIPIKGSATHGILWVNHETTTPHDQIGDGGGASVMEVYRDTVNGWTAVGFPHAINFESVGGTLHNCLGVVTPWGTILTSEEIEPANNRILHPLANDSAHALMVRDTSEVNGWRRWMNFGWMVEVDPIKREVLGKRYAMGRFMHEGNYAMPDEKTIYMLDDEGPGAFFKFVADTARNLRSGQLYAYRHEPDTLGNFWIKLPRSRDSLLHARRFAFQRGATIFFRMEDMEQLPDGTFLISETGKDSINLTAAIALGGKLAPHLQHLELGNKVYEDKHGRLLRYDPKTEKITVYLEGGQALEDKSIVLSNPDNLALDKKHGLLVIQEDLNGTSGGRVPTGTGVMSKPIPASPGKPAQPAAIKVANEIYFLDITKPKVTLDDLHRFAVIPVGFESTGAIFTPDFKSLFINLQSDGQGGVPPYDRSMTVVVTGFGE